VSVAAPPIAPPCAACVLAGVVACADTGVALRLGGGIGLVIAGCDGSC
jgi:hypothetical protein